tara:strand:+ start:1022 stop:1978 length:957 start_codon:yes stop_codon:yes gene_type:complete
MIKLSVVIPIYNEEALLKTVFDRFKNLVEQMHDCCGVERSKIELIFVNDGSTDQSLPQLIDFATENRHVMCINLARNFGHQLAITAGINASSGDAVVVIDGDLQDPPEFIINLYQKHLEGVDVVYAIRKRRFGESWFKLLTAKCFYKMISLLSKTEVIQNVGDFRLMSRRVVNVFNQMPEQHRFIRGMIPWVGFKQEGLLYEREKRYQGKTKFSIKHMINFSMDGITSFSTIPLRLVGILGIGVSILGALYASYVLYEKVIQNSTIQGWTSLMIIILVMGGAQLICLGVIGEYIARIHDQVKHRPLYVIEKTYKKLES